jgi:hypothetical protein
MTTGKRRRREYAEWLPELDLHVGSRWDIAAKEQKSEPEPEIATVVDLRAEERELDVSA